MPEPLAATLVFVAIGTLAGLVAGSFIATLVIRWPQGQGLGGRSRCDGCARTLTTIELVPLISYLAQRGRCRQCTRPIDPRHPAIEATCALIGATALAAEPSWTGAAGALFGWQLLTLAALDAEHFWLPDPLTAMLALTGIAATLLDLGPAPIDSLLGGLAAYASLVLIALTYRSLRHREGLGGGDPKLFGAIGLWLGWAPLPFVLLGASLTGLALVAWMHLMGRAVAADTRLAFGTLLAVAAFPVWLALHFPASPLN